MRTVVRVGDASDDDCVRDGSPPMRVTVDQKEARAGTGRGSRKRKARREAARRARRRSRSKRRRSMPAAEDPLEPVEVEVLDRVAPSASDDEPAPGAGRKEADAERKDADEGEDPDGTLRWLRHTVEKGRYPLVLTMNPQDPVPYQQGWGLDTSEALVEKVAQVLDGYTQVRATVHECAYPGGVLLVGFRAQDKDVIDGNGVEFRMQTMPQTGWEDLLRVMLRGAGQ